MAKDEGVDVAASEAQTQAEADEAAGPAQPGKGELQSAVIQGGVEHPAGSKVSDLDLSDDESDRLKRLGIIS